MEVFVVGGSSLSLPTTLISVHNYSSSSTPPLSPSLFPIKNNNNNNRRGRLPSAWTKTESPKLASKGGAFLSPSRRAAIIELQEASDLASSLSRLEGTIQAQDLNIVLRHFGELRRWKNVIQLFDWMQKHGKVNVASYSSFIKYMGKSLNPMKALEVYNGIQDDSIRRNVSVCNSILGCMIKNGKFESSIKLFDQMKKDGLTPDVVTYSTLLSGCIKVKDGFTKATRLIRELESNGLEMDSVIYGTLLAICASHKLCEEAEMYFQKMKDRGCSPNLFHYSSLLNAYSVDGNQMKADELIEDMKSAGLLPNKVILTTLLKVYVRGGLFEKSRKLLAELQALGHAEDEMPYCLLMDGLAKEGHISEAKAIFDEMKAKGVKSDGYSYSIMISAYCRSELLEEAKQLAKDYEDNYDKYDLVMLNTLLRAYCNTGEMENVMEMLKKMDKLAISPDWNTFHILVKYFCKEKYYQLAYRTVEDMHNKGHPLDEELCSSLILQLAHVGESLKAFSVYNMLRYSKRNLSNSLHERMLKILVSAKHLKEAYLVMKDNAELISGSSLEKFMMSFMKLGNINMINDVVKAFHSSGRRVGMEVFRLAVTRYVSLPEKKELLLHLLQWMSGQGYILDSTSRNSLLKNSRMFGQHLIAEAISKQFAASKNLRIQGTKR
ncbi:Pentatricopeptide repeat-containing protein [Acorus calamus]|uniref:Pentatricopeptide repeat-containing protein n=1 Tax=Acorus calamus TaxID=4465 RepID=A0AAV9DU66_ACOCL|nr:Pentatricopeptide repeat-containing protein [Acorus calamus]